VIYRALPDDKMRLVTASQKLGLVVGMTGDGINDAPALKNADIGFAMGSGTEIAKTAADIVLLNDHFSAIGKTVLYGRTIFHSIQKFVSFQLIMNLAACGVSFLGQFIGIETPITIVQMLWVNMIMDTLGGLAFAGEPPVRHYMLEKPKMRTAAILTGEMVKKVLLIGGFTLAICVLYLKGILLSARFDAIPDNGEFLTGFYALFIFIGLFNCLHTRSDRFWTFHGIFDNKPFVFILSCIAVIQVVIIYRGGALFRSVPLSIGQFSSVVGLASMVIPFDFLRRCFLKLKPSTDIS
jgi:magnesium-transporting ATPase (P-type)